jgi:hypothetical protein
MLDNIHKPEIIIYNNSNQASNYTDIKIIKIDKYSPGKSLNLGVKNAKNKYILILSAHCELKSIDLSKIKSYVEKKYLAVFGNQIPKWNGKKIVKRYLWSHFEENTKVENMFSKLERRYFFHNALSFFKKRDLLKYKFNEILAVGDKNFRKKAMDKMLKICEKGNQTLLFVSHNIDMIKEFCEQCVVLEKGKQVYFGDTNNALNVYDSLQSSI